jgi:SagB-type dehydrogenase family enzyme
MRPLWVEDVWRDGWPFSAGDPVVCLHQHSGLARSTYRRFARSDTSGNPRLESALHAGPREHWNLDVVKGVDRGLEPPPVLRSRRSCRNFVREIGTAESLLDLLSAGLRHERVEHPDGRVEWTACYPSAARTFPVDVYASVRVCDETVDHYHYRPREHLLERLHSTTPAEQFCELSANRHLLRDVPYVLHFVLSRPRVEMRYGYRGYRFGVIEAGAMAQTMACSMAHHGLATLVVGGMFDEPVTDVLRIDGVSELYLFSQLVGSPREQA